jgi:hypothetical protein
MSLCITPFFLIVVWVSMVLRITLSRSWCRRLSLALASSIFLLPVSVFFIVLVLDKNG